MWVNKLGGGGLQKRRENYGKLKFEIWVDL